MNLSVLSVASEAAPLVKTGGLADVVGALPQALAPHGVNLTTMLPGYPAVMATLKKGARAVHKWPDLLGSPARLLPCWCSIARRCLRAPGGHIPIRAVWTGPITGAGSPPFRVPPPMPPRAR
jgi:hypothetical protein